MRLRRLNVSVVLTAALVTLVCGPVAAQSAGESAPSAATQPPRLIRSLSGPSGTVVGAQFVFDETRNRFVYPQDQALTVYFEWEAAPGEHVLSATWRQPDGRVASISPDVKIQSSDVDLRSYWVFPIVSWISRGAWTVEVRINGYPAGSHVFELAGVEGPATRFTLDEVFRTYLPSVVRIHRLGASGQRVDSSSGFVVGANAVATAFQAIDGAHAVEVEFANGRRSSAAGVIALSRLGDWAVLRVDTADVAPIPVEDAGPVRVGGRVSLFDIDSGARIIVPIDVGAVSADPQFGSRIQFTSQVTADAIGGPVIDEGGRVVGIIGGSITPGARVDPRASAAMLWVVRTRLGTGFATMMSDVPSNLAAESRSFDSFHADRTFTPSLEPMEEVLMAGTARSLPRDPADRNIRRETEFSASNGDPIVVFTHWMKMGRRDRGQVSAHIYDVHNRSVMNISSTRVNLRDREQRVSFTTSAKGMPSGYYRIDVLWDGAPAWRTYIRIVD